MIISKKSPLTGKIHSREIAITEEQVATYLKGEKLIQDVFPNLTADEREFILTGITPDEWDDAFKDED